MAKETTILNNYPPDKYNLLIPVLHINAISDLQKIVVNIVQINTDEKSKEVYKEKNEEYAPTKIALMKLAAAANIKVMHSQSIMPSVCRRCAEIARNTQLPPQCGNCKSGGDIAYEVTIDAPTPDGMRRQFVASKEFIIEEQKTKMSTKQYGEFLVHKAALCETKAMLRAIRAALSLKHTYPLADLKKPFAIAYTVPNLDNPELKQAFLQRFIMGNDALFGANLPQAEYTLIESNGAKSIVVSDDEPAESPEDGQDDFNGQIEEELICEDCKEEITPTENWSAVAIADYSKGRFGRNLCVKCQYAAKKFNKKKEANK